MFSVGFAVGLVMGYAISLVTIRYLEKQYPDVRPPAEGRAPFVKRKQERKKPVVMDEFKEFQKEREQLKEQGR
jgi:hypothetical protein